MGSALDRKRNIRSKRLGHNDLKHLALISDCVHHCVHRCVHSESGHNWSSERRLVCFLVHESIIFYPTSGLLNQIILHELC